MTPLAARARGAGRVVRERRIALGLSQLELAAKTGVCLNTISIAERSGQVTKRIAGKISAVLGINPKLMLKKSSMPETPRRASETSASAGLGGDLEVEINKQELEPRTLEHAMQLMAKYRITHLKVDSVELEMSPLGFSLPEVEHQPQPPQEGDRMPTEDELLMWSAGGPLPDVKAHPPKEVP